MRTRLVRVRRRRRGFPGAAIFLMLAAAAYLWAATKAWEPEAGAAVSRGERITREVTLGALDVHLVSLGNFPDSGSARAEAARYVPRGAAGYVLEDGGTAHVIGAGYGTREDAERVAAQLAEQEGIDCTVVSAEGPSAPLRMTAGSEQIAAFIRAEETLRSCVAALGTLSFSIDRGEATMTQARAVVRSRMEEAADACEALIRQTDGAQEGVIGAVSGLLDEVCARMEQLLETETRMALSSGLKYCHVEFGLKEIEMLKKLMKEE